MVVDLLAARAGCDDGGDDALAIDAGIVELLVGVPGVGPYLVARYAGAHPPASATPPHVCSMLVSAAGVDPQIFAHDPVWHASKAVDALDRGAPVAPHSQQLAAVVTAVLATDPSARLHSPFTSSARIRSQLLHPSFDTLWSSAGSDPDLAALRAVLAPSEASNAGSASSSNLELMDANEHAVC